MCTRNCHNNYRILYCHSGRASGTSNRQTSSRLSPLPVLERLTSIQGQENFAHGAPLVRDPTVKAADDVCTYGQRGRLLRTDSGGCAE